MKYFLVTHRPVILYLLYTSSVGQPMSIASRCQNQTPPAISRLSVSPLNGAPCVTIQQGSNREPETKDRQNVEKTRRSAQARVGGSSSMFYGFAHFRVSAKMPLPFGRVSGNLFAKRFPGLLSFGTFLCRSKGKYTQSRTI